MKPFRLLFTGSRHWRDRAAMRAILDDVLSRPGPQAAGSVVLVHGGQRSVDNVTGEIYGADYIAELEFHEAAARAGLTAMVEVHRADWKRFGSGAGPRRNKIMAGLGADQCVACPIGESRGTWDCARRAEKAGIPVVVFEGVPA